MSERAAYSRVYWSIVDDPKFVTVYDNDSHLAAWLRLLLIADQAHPASAHLPSNVRKGSVTALSDAELIDMLPGSRYRIRGLDAERERRRSAATSRPPTGPRPSGPRPVPERSPDGIQTPGLRRDEDETSQDEPTARGSNDPWDDPEHEATVWLSRHGCDLRAGNGFLNHLITLVQEFGVNAVVGMFDRLARDGVRNGDTKGFVFGAKDALYAQHRPNVTAIAKEEAAEERSESRSRLIQVRMWERRHELYRNTGQWDEAWGDPPKDGAA